MALLPNADKVIVTLEKLRDYSLNSAHPRGKHRARVFAAALGIKREDAPHLREIILRAVLTNEAIEVGTNEHGKRYVVDFRIPGLKDSVIIRTAWILDRGEMIPRLTSCYVRG